MSTLFFRLLKTDDKAAALADAVDALRAGQTAKDVYALDPESFRQVPGSPFAYWVGKRARGLWRGLKSLSGAGVLVCSTNPLNEDFRYFRLCWEVSADSVGKRRGWVDLSKGGDYSQYYSDTHLLAAWDDLEASYRGFNGTVNRPLKRPASAHLFFRPGLTYSRRSQIGFSARVLPGAAIFHDKGPGIFPTGPKQWSIYLGILNSRAFRYLLGMQVSFGSYEVGVVQSTPVPEISSGGGERIGKLALDAIKLKRDLDQDNEISHVFHLPALLQVPGTTLADRIASWHSRVAETDRQLAEHQREIDDIAFRLYGIEGEDRALLEGPETPALSCIEGKSEPSEEDEP
jgi:hypothetical protein